MINLQPVALLPPNVISTHISNALKTNEPEISLPNEPALLVIHDRLQSTEQVPVAPARNSTTSKYYHSSVTKESLKSSKSYAVFLFSQAGAVAYLSPRILLVPPYPISSELVVSQCPCFVKVRNMSV